MEITIMFLISSDGLKFKYSRVLITQISREIQFYLTSIFLELNNSIFFLNTNKFKLAIIVHLLTTITIKMFYSPLIIFVLI